MKLRAVTFLLVPLSVLGCGNADYSKPAMEAATEGMALTDSSGSMAVADAAMPMPTEAAVKRKIVYTADVDIVVEEFDQVPSQVKDLAEQSPGPTSAADRAVLGAASGRSACLWRITKNSWPPPDVDDRVRSAVRQGSC